MKMKHLQESVPSHLILQLTSIPCLAFYLQIRLRLPQGRKPFLPGYSTDSQHMQLKDLFWSLFFSLKSQRKKMHLRSLSSPLPSAGLVVQGNSWIPTDQTTCSSAQKRRCCLCLTVTSLCQFHSPRPTINLSKTNQSVVSKTPRLKIKALECFRTAAQISSRSSF